MADAIITVENLGKKYRLGAKSNERYTALRDVISGRAKSLFKKSGYSRGSISDAQRRSAFMEDFWALKDVSFEVNEGEVVGIIGRNGAGKSTLLKIVSRITDPTHGTVRLKGRVASLLEVGTGFHPELTGRENIYLNGAILGMRRAEIQRKFDEIVAFSETEKFLDTPVKRYSSGMYVRLAFAVAAHLEPDILIIDEVLAVGDAEFQKKCLVKMEQVGSSGRTVLLVSHNLGMITSMCNRALLFCNGSLRDAGAATQVVLKYQRNSSESPAFVDFYNEGTVVGDDFVRLLSCWVKNSKGEFTSEFDLNEAIRIGMKFRILQPRSFTANKPYPQVNLFGASGEVVCECIAPRAVLEYGGPKTYIAECTVPPQLLNNQTYHVGLGFGTCDPSLQVHFYDPNILSFHVREDMSLSLLQARNGFSGPLRGPVRPKLDWKVHVEPSAMN